MIERYTKPEMGHIWTEYNEWDTMKQVEILASEAQAELGNIPKEAAKEIREKAAFSVDRIHEIEAETHHDIAAFVSTLSENIGEAGKYVHLGLTSTDVKDTALGYMLKQASDILIKDLENFHAVLRRRAVEFKYTPCIGRTHGIHAEATTFGLKLCNWMAEIERDIDRMKQQSVALKFLQVTTGTLVPTATVVLKFGDHGRMAIATGNGPVDAAVSAIKKLINEKVVLSEFLMQAITRGSNDVGRVHVQVECGSRTVHGFAAHTDTTRASIEAFLDALRALNVTEKREEEA